MKKVLSSILVIAMAFTMVMSASVITVSANTVRVSSETEPQPWILPNIGWGYIQISFEAPPLNWTVAEVNEGFVTQAIYIYVDKPMQAWVQRIADPPRNHRFVLRRIAPDRPASLVLIHCGLFQPSDLSRRQWQTNSDTLVLEFGTWTGYQWDPWNASWNHQESIRINFVHPEEPTHPDYTVSNIRRDETDIIFDLENLTGELRTLHLIAANFVGGRQTQSQVIPIPIAADFDDTINHPFPSWTNSDTAIFLWEAGTMMPLLGRLTFGDIEFIPTPINVPNAVGISQANARTALETAGFVVSVVEQYHASVAVGDVISQIPAADTMATAGSTVTITVSLGVQPPPNVHSSSITLPERILTTQEMQAWQAEYAEMGGTSTFELEVLRLANIERAAVGAPPLVMDPTLAMAARFKSQSMANLNYSSHTGVYGEPWDLMRAFGFNPGAAAENIAQGQTTPAAVITSWMNSEGHRTNMLNPTYRVIGVGAYVDAFGRINWTQMFSSTVTQPTTINVPNVVGNSQANARTALEAAGFVVNVVEQYHASVAAGNVISQNPAAGTAVTAGSTVTITVSRGQQAPQQPPNFHSSSITLPAREMTNAELLEWIEEYEEMGGKSWFELEIVQLVNNERVNVGLSSLTIDPVLSMAARLKAQSQATHGYEEHDGGPMWGVMVGYIFGVWDALDILWPFLWLNENLAWTGSTASPETAVAAWMGSTAHRNTIYRDTYDLTGVGVYRASNGRLHWVQMFAEIRP